MSFACRISILDFELVNLMLPSLTFPGKSIRITPISGSIFPVLFRKEMKRGFYRKEESAT